MKKWLNLFLLFAGLQAAAQQKSVMYDGRVQAGVLEGEAGSAFQLQTINGVRYKTWSVGIGAGVDYYKVRSFPLFLAVQKNIGAAEKAPFVYANGGYHFPWLNAAQKDWRYDHASGGFYGEAGIGYQLSVGKKSALFFTAGLSQKNYSMDEVYPVMIDIFPQPPATTYRVDYQLRRLSIQTGLRF